MKNSGINRIVATASEMSNLVGMYGVLIVENKIGERILVIGKADSEHFIIQYISMLDGSFNVAELVTIKELRRWIFIPNLELFNEMLTDYFDNQNTWRYGVYTK